jgi:hypothetical protein
MTSNNGYLESTDYNAYAVSETYPVPNQYAGEMDVIVAKWEYYNISQSTDANVLKTVEPIQNGDKMIVIINNNPVEIIAYNVVDDTMNSGFYLMYINEMNGAIPEYVYLTDKYIHLNFGNGYRLLYPESDTFIFNNKLESVTKYKEIQYNTNIVNTRVDILQRYNRMIEFRSKFCDIIGECFLSIDNYKIQTTDDYIFCAV